MRLAAITEELMNFLNKFMVLHEQGKTQGGRGWRGGREFKKIKSNSKRKLAKQFGKRQNHRKKTFYLM